MEKVLFRNRRPDRPATIDEYRASGGYEALAKALTSMTPRDVAEVVRASGLRGRGGAGFPAGRKWESINPDYTGPRYLLPNTDEMEPGTFKDRILVNADPHLVLEGIILSAYAIGAQRGIFFIRPSYELDAQIIERELAVARQAGFLGENILGSNFSFELSVHRSAGRYICGEASAQINAIQARRPNPRKGVRSTEKGLWDCPTVVNNVETLSCVSDIVRRGADWFKTLAATPTGDGNKLYCVSGMVAAPDCYELPMGTTLREIIFEHGGGMLPGREFKACLPGGSSTALMPASLLDTPMDFDSMKKAGQRLGTGSVIVFDKNVCLIKAMLNIINFFVRESCGWCTPCREGLPMIRDLLLRIENGEGKEEHIGRLKDMTKMMRHAYCAFAPGAAAPVEGLLEHFEDELREHISLKACPFGVGKPRCGDWEARQFEY